MANSSAKKVLAENAKILRTLLIVMAVSHAIMALFVWQRWEATSKKVLFGHAVNSGAMLLAYSLLKKTARPHYDERGALVDGGADLKMAGALHSLYFDVLYICVFVQVCASVISSRFWLVHILTVSLVGYKLWSSIVQPLLKANPLAGGDEQFGDEQEEDRYAGKNRSERRKMQREDRKKARKEKGF